MLFILGSRRLTADTLSHSADIVAQFVLANLRLAFFSYIERVGQRKLVTAVKFVCHSSRRILPMFVVFIHLRWVAKIVSDAF